MKRINLILFVLCMFSFLIKVNAKAINLTECEYTDEYKKWAKLSESQRNDIEEPTMCKYEKNTSLVNYKSSTIGNSTIYDSRFDLRDYNKVTSVKGQESSGLCWGFSSFASVESNLLVNNYGLYDLSESHLDLSTQSQYDLNRAMFNRNQNRGGNPRIAMAYLANKRGPVTENLFPLSTSLSFSKNNASDKNEIIKNVLYSKPIVNVDNMTKITGQGSFIRNACTNENISNIKNYLIHNGAVVSNAMFQSWTTNDIRQNYEADPYKIYPDGTTIYTVEGGYMYGPYLYYYEEPKTGKYTKLNQSDVGAYHAVAIVGWDDNIDTSNFVDPKGVEYYVNLYLQKDGITKDDENYNEKYEEYYKDFYKRIPTKQPTRKGAWIVKNSYDTIKNGFVRGEEGYFYVSYDDLLICSDIYGFYNANLDVPDNIYSHDELGYSDIKIESSGKDLYAGAIFNKETKNNEKLTKITFGTASSGMNYKIYYAPNSSFSDLKEISQGTTETMYGYETVDVSNKNIYINDDYSIVVKYSKTQGKTYLPTSSRINNNSSFYSKNIINPEATFLSYDMENWSDTSKSKLSLENSEGNVTAGFNLSIKAYTKNVKESTNDSDDKKDDKNDNNQKNNLDGSINVKENPNNEKSFIDKTNNLKNPKTNDNILYIIICIILGSTLSIITVKRILKQK